MEVVGVEVRLFAGGNKTDVKGANLFTGLCGK
jgi:hypothetical protein